MTFHPTNFPKLSYVVTSLSAGNEMWFELTKCSSKTLWTKDTLLTLGSRHYLTKLVSNMYATTIDPISFWPNNLTTNIFLCIFFFQTNKYCLASSYLQEWSAIVLLSTHVFLIVYTPLCFSDCARVYSALYWFDVRMLFCLKYDVFLFPHRFLCSSTENDNEKLAAVAPKQSAALPSPPYHFWPWTRFLVFWRTLLSLPHLPLPQWFATTLWPPHQRSR